MNLLVVLASAVPLDAIAHVYLHFSLSGIHCLSPFLVSALNIWHMCFSNELSSSSIRCKIETEYHHTDLHITCESFRIQLINDYVKNMCVTCGLLHVIR